MKESEEDRLKCVVYESTRAPPKKEANPASLRSAAPSKGRGSREYSLLPLEGGAPKGRRLDGRSGMKESEGDRLKCIVYESTLSTAARSPFPNGEGYETRMPLFSHRQSEYMHMWKKNNDGQSLPRVGKVASKASRIGFWRYEKEREDRLKCVVYESTLSTATRSPFPNGEGYETRIPLSSHCQNKYTHMWKKITTDKAFPAWAMLLS